MKKTILLLSLIAITALCSCGGGNEPQSLQNASTSQQEGITVIYEDYKGQTLYKTQMTGDEIPPFPEGQTLPIKPHCLYCKGLSFFHYLRRNPPLFQPILRSVNFQIKRAKIFRNFLWHERFLLHNWSRQEFSPVPSNRQFSYFQAHR